MSVQRLFMRSCKPQGWLMITLKHALFIKGNKFECPYFAMKKSENLIKAGNKGITQLILELPLITVYPAETPSNIVFLVKVRNSINCFFACYIKNSLKYCVFDENEGFY